VDYGGESSMDGKPLHYDGSVQNEYAENSEKNANEKFIITDEMRKNISVNPYGITNEE
jgi:hypothetical protein